MTFLVLFQYVQAEPPTNKGLANLTGQLLQFQEVNGLIPCMHVITKQFTCLKITTRRM